MLNIMGRLLNPNNGKVLVDNIDIHKEKFDSVKNFNDFKAGKNSFGN